MAALCLALLGAIPQRYVTHYFVKQFADCRDAAAFAAAHATLGHYTYRLGAKLSQARIVAAGNGEFEARGRAVITLSNPQLQLPKWSWPGVSAAQRTVYDAFIAALRQHEVGHAKIAEVSIGARAVDLTMLAHSRVQAERALRSALQRQLRSASDELLHKEELYDRVTEHGRKQSDGPLYGFPGGTDVVFSCP